MNFASKFTTRTIAVALAGMAAIIVGTIGWGHAIPTHHLMAMVGNSFTLMVGVATIIQTWPFAGTFPTSAQAVSYNTQISRVVMADGDTIAVLTHNWMIPAAQLAAFFPLIIWYVENVGATAPPVSFALTDSNTVTMSKTGTTGSGGTFVVTLQRPYSATQ